VSAILTLTVNPTIDLATTTERVETTRKMRCAVPRRDPGGGGINAARVVRELGGEVAALYTAGGPTGGALKELLSAMGMDCCTIPIGDDTRVSFTCFEESTGEEYRFVMPGPRLSEAECRACLDAVAKHDPTSRFVVGSGSLPPGVPDDFYAELARSAKAVGARPVIDASGAALGAALDEGVYLTKPNKRELEDYVGKKLDDPEDQDIAAMDLVERGAAEIVALTLGEAGALLATRDGVLRIAAPEVEPESAVGAGDSFIGGMCFALAEDHAIADAFRYGVAAGTAALLTAGTELCRRDDVERLYRAIKAERA